MPIILGLAVAGLLLLLWERKDTRATARKALEENKRIAKEYRSVMDREMAMIERRDKWSA